MNGLKSKLDNIVMGCCGSIGIIAIPNLILSLRLAFKSNINLVMTKSAAEFITPLCFQTLTGNKVLTHNDFLSRYEYSEIIKNARLLLIAPATANIIGKFSSGVCDDLLTYLFLKAQCPIFLAPSMNEKMWNNTITIKNIKNLKEKNINIINPINGLEISTMKTSKSSMSDIDKIIEEMIINL